MINAHWLLSISTIKLPFLNAENNDLYQKKAPTIQVVGAFQKVALFINFR